MSRALSVLFGAGATLVGATLVVPHSGTVSAWGVALPVALAYLIAGGLFLSAGHLPRWAIHVFLACGTALVSSIAYSAGTAASSVAYAILYVWVALYSFYFFSIWAASAHVALAGATYAAILSLTESGNDWIASWMMTLGVVTVTGMMVGWLVDQIRSLAQTDWLTGLPNRRSWDDALVREITRAERYRMPLTVVLIDLDHFKLLNDTQGHQAGDLLLKELAAAWHDKLRTTDLIARLGGDEFGILLPDCPLEEAGKVVDRLDEATPPGHTTSTGVALWYRGEQPAALLKRADEALYSAKKSGRARTVFSPPTGALAQAAHDQLLPPGH